MDDDSKSNEKSDYGEVLMGIYNLIIFTFKKPPKKFDITNSLNTLKYSQNNFIYLILKCPDFVEDSFAMILRWGLKYDIISIYEADSIVISQYCDLLSGFICFHSGNKRNLLINNIINTINILFGSLNLQTLKIPEPSILKKPPEFTFSSQSHIYNSLLLLLNTLDKYIFQYAINQPDILPLIYQLLISDKKDLNKISLRLLSIALSSVFSSISK